MPISGCRVGRDSVDTEVLTGAELTLAGRSAGGATPREAEQGLAESVGGHPEQLLLAIDKQSSMPMVRIGEALIAMGLINDEQLCQCAGAPKPGPLGAAGRSRWRQTGLVTHESCCSPWRWKMGRIRWWT